MAGGLISIIVEDLSTVIPGAAEAPGPVVIRLDEIEAVSRERVEGGYVSLVRTRTFGVIRAHRPNYKQICARWEREEE